nr:longitudinals lacking protein-like [Onthophagus taurus]
MDQQFCLRWNNHPTNLTDVLLSLLRRQALCDVTLACEGETLKAHQTILSACSPYFEMLLIKNVHPHPIIYLKDVNYNEMKALLDFMYKGEVNVSQHLLPMFLKTAEALQIRGLTDHNQLNSKVDAPVDVPKREWPPEHDSQPHEKRKRKSSNNNCDNNQERYNDSQPPSNYKTTVPKLTPITTEKDAHMDDLRVTPPMVKQELTHDGAQVDSFHCMSEALQTGGSISVHPDDVLSNQALSETSESESTAPVLPPQEINDAIDGGRKVGGEPKKLDVVEKLQGTQLPEESSQQSSLILASLDADFHKNQRKMKTQSNRCKTLKDETLNSSADEFYSANYFNSVIDINKIEIGETVVEETKTDIDEKIKNDGNDVGVIQILDSDDDDTLDDEEILATSTQHPSKILASSDDKFHKNQRRRNSTKQNSISEAEINNFNDEVKTQEYWKIVLGLCDKSQDEEKLKQDKTICSSSDETTCDPEEIEKYKSKINEIDSNDETICDLEDYQECSPKIDVKGKITETSSELIDVLNSSEETQYDNHTLVDILNDTNQVDNETINENNKRVKCNASERSDTELKKKIKEPQYKICRICTIWTTNLKKHLQEQHKSYYLKNKDKIRYQ